MRHPGEVLTRYQLLEQAWDYDYENRSNVVDVYVRYLRDKIDRPFGVQSRDGPRGGLPAGGRLTAASSPTDPAASWRAGRTGSPCAAARRPTAPRHPR